MNMKNASDAESVNHEPNSHLQEQTACTFDFGSMAERYDDWYATPRGRMYDRLEKNALLHLLPRMPVRQMYLLDVGCGTGHWSCFLAESGYHVTGVDCSEEMVRVARTRETPDMQFEIADATELPFGDGSFDVVIAITSLEFCSRPEKMLSEMVRSVRPGGSIIIAGLNGLAPINCARRGKPPYSYALWLNPGKLHCLLSQFGKPEIVVAGFVPQHDALLWAAPAWERLARGLKLSHGALVVGKVVK